MNDDLRVCSSCRSAYSSRWRGGELVYYCAHCATRAASDSELPEAERDALRARAEAAEQRAEAAEAALAQAHADRTLLTGLWLATVPPDVLPALLPADLGDRDRLAAALDAVDLQASAGSHTAAVRAVIGRIVAETARGAR